VWGILVCFTKHLLSFSYVASQCSWLRCCRCWGVQVRWALPWWTRRGSIWGCWHATPPSGLGSELPRMCWRDCWELLWEAALRWVKHKLDTSTWWAIYRLSLILSTDPSSCIIIWVRIDKAIMFSENILYVTNICENVKFKLYCDMSQYAVLKKWTLNEHNVLFSLLPLSVGSHLCLHSWLAVCLVLSYIPADN